MLSRHAARLAFYRPFVTSADAPDPAIELIRHRYRLPEARLGSALTADDLRNLDGRDSYDALLKRVLNGYAELSDADVVVIEGSDFTEASLAVELDLNVDVASHLGSPVLLVVGGRRRRVEQVLDAVHQGLGTLRRARLRAARSGVQPGAAGAGRRGAGRRRGGGRRPAGRPCCRRFRCSPRPPSPRWRPG